MVEPKKVNVGKLCEYFRLNGMKGLDGIENYSFANPDPNDGYIDLKGPSRKDASGKCYVTERVTFSTSGAITLTTTGKQVNFSFFDWLFGNKNLCDKFSKSNTVRSLPEDVAKNALAALGENIGDPEFVKEHSWFIDKTLKVLFGLETAPQVVPPEIK